MSRRKPRGGEAREAQLPFEPMANARPEAVLDGQADRLPQQQLAEADDRLAFEKALWGQGAGLVCGVDEVGRGCLFGDVVAAAVVLPAGLVLDGVHDSKKLSEKKREQLYDVIAESAVAWAVARIDAAEIDRINIRQASRLAMKKRSKRWESRRTICSSMRRRLRSICRRRGSSTAMRSASRSGPPRSWPR